MAHKRKKRSEKLKDRKKLGEDNAPVVNGDEDDCPKAFKHLLKQREIYEAKRLERKIAKTEKKKPIIKRLPGEKMSEFSQRVNRAIPVSFKSGPVKVDEFTDKKTAKKIKRKQEKREAELDEKEMELEDTNWEAETTGQYIPIESHRKRKGSPDPWESLNKQRPAFNERVDAPPVLPSLKKTSIIHSIPKKDKQGNTESLARRKALGEERQALIERYRAMMQARRS
ncbi:fungal protein [Schizosaccharomyces japonicus yFS275]|uniref:Fungal protein n=1 Tax=Schizosaccharomyces japonicus (strain yFS275 / FY16936) TaxID=402676 RepID=B6K466_SCHJY|nr:fungal protein [Schizosaccharomyces japonicus yFS275]EEB08273.1 fungal protein [Schizosaccharomyces japonicus yFS275]